VFVCDFTVYMLDDDTRSEFLHIRPTSGGYRWSGNKPRKIKVSVFKNNTLLNMCDVLCTSFAKAPTSHYGTVPITPRGMLNKALGAKKPISEHVRRVMTMVGNS
jgi:hypothetical protein